MLLGIALWIGVEWIEEHYHRGERPKDRNCEVKINVHG